MKLFYALLLFTFLNSNAQQTYNPELNKYVTFIQENNQPAKDYILSQFKENDLVILCERYHSENTQYDLILDVISDSIFIENVGNVFFETGIRNINSELNNFIHSENLTEKEIQERLINIQRKSDYYPLWEMYNFYDQNKRVYELNQSLPQDKKVNLYASDLSINLDSLSVSYLKNFDDNDLENRDQLMAEFIIENFERIKKSNVNRKKALIIMNYRHAYNRNFKMDNGEMINNVGAYIFEKYPNTTANILINSVIIQDGKWDAAFEVAHKDNIGFNFKDSPFGEDHFDMWTFTKHDDKYKDIFTGFVYYKSPKEFKMIMGVDGLIDESFLPIYKNKVRLWNQIRDVGYPLDDETIYKEFGKKNVEPLENLDSLTTLINNWLKG